MQCFVYKSLAKPDTYVYLDRRDDVSHLPEGLRTLLGRLSFVLELELTPDAKLAREKPADVLGNLRERGYHLQLPEKIFPLDERGGPH